MKHKQHDVIVEGKPIRNNWFDDKTMKHKHYDVIVAWAEGKPIQYLSGKHWFDVPTIEGGASPNFNICNMGWRIKPAAKIIKYRLALMEHSASYYVKCFNETETYYKQETNKKFLNWITDWTEYEIVS